MSDEHALDLETEGHASTRLRTQRWKTGESEHGLEQSCTSLAPSGQACPPSRWCASARPP